MRDGFRWSPDGRRIAYWQFDTSGVGIFTLINNTDSVYPVVDAHPLSQAGHDQLGGAHRRRRRRRAATRRWMQTPGDPRDSYLARLEWQDDGDARHPAAEPPAEPAGPAERRRRARARWRASFRDRVRDLGRRRRHRALGGPGPGVPVAQRARRLAARLPGRHRRHVHDAGHAVRRRRHAARWAWTPPTSGSTSSRRPTTPTARYLYRARARRPGRARARDAGRPARHPQLPARARRAAGVPHLFALRRAAGDRRRRAARPPRAARAHRHGGAAQDARAGHHPPGRVLHRGHRTAASRSTAGC